MNYRLYTIMLGIFFLLSSCNQAEEVNDPVKNIELDKKSAQLIEADNAFGFDLFRELRENSEEENILVSPLSVSLALGMAYNGAAGETKAEMEQAMKLNGLTPEEINQSYKMLIAALQSLDEKVIFEIADAIFYAKGFAVKQNFIDLNSTYYNAEVEALDFSKTATVETINDWVAEKTRDKILTIIETLSPYDRMILLNAIYFYGTWAVEFDEDGTKLNRFYRNDGGQPEVAMMSKEDKLEYTSNEIFSAVKLPYGSGQYNMVVMLPNNGHTSADLIAELNNKNWKEWMGEYSTHENVVISMPRFKFAYQSNLNDVLASMGMKKAFSSSEADFSEISEEFLYISRVIHKTYIDVNETGTEAAAVTAVVFTTTSIEPGPAKLYFTVNKPFVFAISEKDTDAILFIGEVQNPEYED